jgi:hypothetical protein
MKVLGELCKCRLCRSSGSKGPAGRWWPCGCIIGQEADDHYTHKVEGVEVEGQVYPIDRVVHTNSRRCETVANFCLKVYIYSIVWLRSF